MHEYIKYEPMQIHIKYEHVHTNINIYGNKTYAKLFNNRKHYNNHQIFKNNKKYLFQTHKHYCLMVAKLH